jgi:prepilin-type N-terminal cleavage/methylation domain-containing protein
MFFRPVFSVKSRCRQAWGAFTLVELLVTVAVLAIGIVGILRSFLSAYSALESTNMRLGAFQAIEARMPPVLLSDGSDPLLTVGSGREALELGGRKAELRWQTGPLAEDGMQERLNQVTISVVWSEGHREKDETIVFLAAREQ